LELCIIFRTTTRIEIYCFEEPGLEPFLNWNCSNILCSTQVALAVLCQIINLIQKIWFGSYLFNSENSEKCVIYVINSFVFLKYFVVE
jgi:hypothetical protein